MNDLLERLVNAIFRQEGMNEAWLNPGNLRAAPWLANPVIRNGYWRPNTRAEGVAGAAHVVALHIAKGDSLTQLISIWAPASDGNPTDAYLTNVKSWAGIPDATVPLWTFIGV